MSLGRRAWALGVDTAMTVPQGRWLIWYFGQMYSAGNSVPEGFETIQRQWEENGWRSTFDMFGEAATTPERAESYWGEYLDAIRRGATINREAGSRVVSVSTKPTSICAITGEGILDRRTSLPERLERLVKIAGSQGVSITQDMEDRHYTDMSLVAAQHVWTRGHENFEIVLQFRLHRTFEDIDTYLRRPQYSVPREAMSVRACIGTYPETPEYAVNDAEAKMRLIEGVNQLFDLGIHVSIATHDPEVVRTAQETIRSKGIPRERYTFEFLNGVELGRQLASRLVQEGNDVRFYMGVEPYKYAGTRYFARRAKENPRLLMQYLQNRRQMMRRPGGTPLSV